MLANQQRAGATPDAQGAAPAQAPGRSTRTASLTGGGGGTTAPAGYLGAGNLDGDPDVMNIDSEAELRPLLARLEFMATFVDVGVDRAEVIDELTSMRARIDALAPTLTPAQLERVRAQLHAAEDAVLRAVQARVVAGAQREEAAGVSEDDGAGLARIVEYARGIGWGDDVYVDGGEVMRAWTDKKTGAARTGTYQWCGAFAGFNYVESGGLDPELARSFSSAPSLVDFFTYDWGRRNPRTIAIDGQRLDVRAYHEARGSMRRWWGPEQLDALIAAGDLASLPIRPGDIVIYNWDGGDEDHVGMVQSWNPTTGVLRTVEGNTSQIGGPSHEAVEDHIDRSDHLGDTRSDGERVSGIGRPSIVDLEVHDYDNDPPDPAPVPAP